MKLKKPMCCYCSETNEFLKCYRALYVAFHILYSNVAYMESLINDALCISCILKYSTPTSQPHLFNLVQTKFKPQTSQQPVKTMNQSLPEKRQSKSRGSSPARNPQCFQTESPFQDIFHHKHQKHSDGNGKTNCKNYY